MYYSEWVWNFEDAIIGFLIHEQPLTYESNWERYNGFYLNLGPIRLNKKVRPKTRILKIYGGYYFNKIDNLIYRKEYIKFISMNQKLTPTEEIRIKGGIKFKRL